MPNHPPYLNPEHLVVGESWPESREALAQSNGLQQTINALAKHSRVGQGVFDDATLATFRDSRSQPVARWPDKALPSTTVIIYEPSASGRIKEVLIHQRRDNHHWGFPGGHMEPGESIRQCARREAKEESGLDVIIGALVSVDTDPTQYAVNCYPDGSIVHYCNLCFIGTVASGILAMSQESTALLWVDAETLPHPFLPAHAWRLQAARRVMEGGNVQVR